MAKGKIVVGNWKMNPANVKDAEKLLSGISKTLPRVKKTNIVACPPFIYLEKLKKSSRKIALGAQDAFWGETGAFTGEVSAEMLYDLGMRYVILGHSERRALGESHSDIQKKLKASLAAGLVVILCVGERERDEEHAYLEFVKRQILDSLAGVSKNSLSKIIVAYEPVWAIGKSAVREATPEEFQEMKIFIKKILSDKFGKSDAENVKILYGGSVRPDNALLFIKNGETDGFLVGRDSLSPVKFSEIVKTCEA